MKNVFTDKNKPIFIINKHKLNDYIKKNTDNMKKKRKKLKKTEGRINFEIDHLFP